MTKKKLLFLLTAWLLFGYCLMGQTVRVLRLDEVYAMADTASQAVRAARSSHASASEAQAAAKRSGLPDLNFSISASYHGRGWVSDRDFSNGTSVDIPHFGNNLAVEASQVLYAGGAISSAIRMAELSTQIAALDVTQRRQEIRFLLTSCYLEIYKTINQLHVVGQNIELTRQVLRNMEARYEQGTILSNDITRYELQLQKLELQQIQLEDARAILNHQMVTTLHLPAGTQLLPDTTLLDRQLSIMAGSDWQELAESNNAGLQQAELAVSLAQQKVRQEQASLKPKIALVAEEHLDGPILIEVPTIDSNFNYWFAGIGVKYNLSALYKDRKNVSRARAEVRQAQDLLAEAKEHVETDVQAAYVNLLTAFRVVSTHQKNVELADANYQVTANRYESDLALLTEMLDASNTKLSASLDLVNARINLLYQYYKLKFITHTL